jgi:hypothetical protein
MNLENPIHAQARKKRGIFTYHSYDSFEDSNEFREPDSCTGRCCIIFSYHVCEESNEFGFGTQFMHRQVL